MRSVKRQTSLLGFFKPHCEVSPTVLSGNSDTNVPAPGVSVDVNEELSIIPDTPVSFSPGAKPLTGKPTLVLSELSTDGSRHSAPPQKQYTHRRRSSFVVQRQLALQEKNGLLLSPDAGPTGETQAACWNRQATAAAKLRRGNYDELNYAPVDQVEKKPTRPPCKPFSRRTELLVSKAMATPSRSPTNSLIQKPSQKRQEVPSFSPESKVDVCREKQPRAKKKDIVPVPSLSTFSLVENDALEEVMRLINEPKNTSLPKRLRVDRSYIDTRIDREQRALQATSFTTAAKTTPVDAEVQQIDPNDSFSALNLSDWSLDGEREEVHVRVGKLDYESPYSSRPFFRGRVTAVESCHDRIFAIVTLISNAYCDASTRPELLGLELTDSWAETELHVGDVVHVIPGVGGFTRGRHIVIGDSNSVDTETKQSLTPSFVVVHPDLLIAGTKLVGSLYCSRRSALEHFWPSGEDDDFSAISTTMAAETSHDNPGRVMLVGSLVHEMFQKLIVMDRPTKSDAHNFVESVLRRLDTVLSMYACKCKASEIRTAVSGYILRVLDWIETYCEKPVQAQQRLRKCAPSPSSHPSVHKIVDIEENIWSTKFGIKGKIDLSALCHLPPSYIRQPSSCRTESASDGLKADWDSLSLVPIELKTGRPSYSVEHKGQVLVYMLMLLDRYGSTYSSSSVSGAAKTASGGWLVYLQEQVYADTGMGSNRPQRNSSLPGMIKPDMGSFRGLIQTRNRVASSLHAVTESSGLPVTDPATCGDRWFPRLPSPIKKLHSCRSCPAQLACSLFDPSSSGSLGRSKTHRPSQDSTAGTNSIDTVGDLLLARRSHLSAQHLSFFSHWSQLLMMENHSSDRLEKTIEQLVGASFVSNSSSPSALGSVRHLKIVTSDCSDKAASGCCRIILGPPRRRDDLAEPKIMPESGLSPGDLVIVSSDDGQHVGFTLATIGSDPSVSNENVPPGCICLLTDRPLPSWIDFFRLDRYPSSKSTELSLCNLIGLMQDSSLCRYLRETIIDGCRPTFSPTIPKRVISEIRPIMKELNHAQRTAILRVLMSEQYVLIKGFPGTGKTETLASLLRVLILLGKNVLVVAHTHSAVDNLLTRLIQSGEKKILRLGKADRISPDLMQYSFEFLVSQQLSKNSGSSRLSTTDFINSLIDEAAVVGCTALAASGGAGGRHVALGRKRFNLVLVDEASQLLLPTALGALLCLSSSSVDNDAAGRFVLVGDPCQLPPLVQSRKARQAGLDQSLFTYLLNLGQEKSKSDGRLPISGSCTSFGTQTSATVELNVQYRMNAPILSLANELCYANAMRCANTIVANCTLSDRLNHCSDESPIWLKRALSSALADAAIYLDTCQLNICSSKTSVGGRKLNNPTEAAIICHILHKWIALGLSPSDVGIISPHRIQVALFRRLLNSPDCSSCPSSTRCCHDLNQVEVNTVDQFQGRDKRAVLLSLTLCTHSQLIDSVTSTQSSSLGIPRTLLDDLPRLAVALTRAKHKLVIVGCSGGCAQAQKQGLNHSSGPLDQLFNLFRKLGGYECISVSSCPPFVTKPNE